MKIHCKKLIFTIGTLILFSIRPAFSMEIAITVDDIPVNGDIPPDQSRLDITNKILEVFKKHHINAVYGLINGSKVEATSDGYIILQQWLAKGQLLGNHTFSHLDIAKTQSDEYIADIKKNEAILNQLMMGKDYRYFRYPYLSEGNTQEKRDAVLEYLFKNSYQIAPVTVDFFEYEWNDPYVRCLNMHDEDAIAWLRKTYIQQAVNALTISHELSMMLFNRDIKNVLLIHLNSFTAEMLDELLTVYEQNNVKFISLPDALSDDVYKINPNIIRERAYTFLNQIRLARDLKNPDIVIKLYDSLSEDILHELCT